MPQSLPSRSYIHHVSATTSPVFARALNGEGTPDANQIPATNGTFWINRTDSTLWVAVNGIWKQLV